MKSAAGITLRVPDGTTYKFERKQLSARTIADLGLPPENPVPNSNQPPAHRDATPSAATGPKTEEMRPAASATPVRPSQAPSNATYRVVGLPKNTAVLNIREGPGSTFPIVGTLPPNATGIVLGGAKRVTNGWTVWQEITAAGYTGWVNAQYLAPEPAPP